MHTANRLRTGHADIIHDVKYDYYGSRLATCSSDQTIRIWELGPEGSWNITADWKANKGSVWRIDWAHPEYGQVIASCSFDKSVCIWEEGEDDDGKPVWRKRSELVDSRDSVQDLEFAPHQLGLKLATCSLDGYIRIYEAIDVTDLSCWSMDDFEACKGGGGASSVTWNPSPFDPPCLLVGTKSPEAIVWQYNKATRRWEVLHELKGHTDEVHSVAWAPNLGRSFHLVATASKDKTVRIWKLPTTSWTKFDAHEVACLKEHGSEVWRVSWNITGTILASSGGDGNVRLWKADYHGNWKEFSKLAGES